MKGSKNKRVEIQLVSSETFFVNRNTKRERERKKDVREKGMSERKRGTSERSGMGYERESIGEGYRV